MSIRIQIPFVALISLCLLAASMFSQAEAVTAHVKDSSTDEYIPCGDVKLLEVDDSQVRLTTEGISCLDSADTPISAPILPASLPQPEIDEAGVRYIDLAGNATVKLGGNGSVDVNVGSKSEKGGTITIVADSSAFPHLVGSVIKYTAPTLEAGDVEDSFRYGLTDANAASGLVGTVTIGVRDVAVTPEPTDGCTSSSVLNCLGDLNELNKFPSGLLLNLVAEDGKVEAWSFTYKKTNVSPPATPNPGAFIVFDGTGKEVSISSIAGDMGPKEADGSIDKKGYPCARWLPNEYSLYFNLANEAASNECPLKEGGVYYLNIRNRAGQIPRYRLDISEH